MVYQRSVSDLCKEHQITPEELAARCGVDPQRVLAIALGRWTPSPQERDKVAAVFGLTKDQISWGHKTLVSGGVGCGGVHAVPPATSTPAGMLTVKVVELVDGTPGRIASKVVRLTAGHTRQSPLKVILRL